MAVHCLLAYHGPNQRPVLVGSGEHAGVRVFLRDRLRLRPRDAGLLLDQEGLECRLGDIKGRPGEKSSTESQEASETSCSSLSPARRGEDALSLRSTPRPSEVRQPADEGGARRLHLLETRSLFLIDLFPEPDPH